MRTRTGLVGKAGRGAPGFSMLEAILALTVLVLAAGAFTQALAAVRLAGTTGDARTKQQGQARRGLTVLSEELRSSGFVVLGGMAYPHLFEGGAPSSDFDANEHEPAMKEANPGESDFGPNREVVFLRPLDADADGVPDVDAEGVLQWDPREFAFVVNTGDDGVNRLELWVDGAFVRRIARGVERLVIDDAVTSNFEVPFGALRVRLWLRDRDADHHLHRSFAETTLRLRNSEVF